MASISFMILSAFLRSCSIHQARSSKAAGSNSKLLADFIEGNPLGSLQCLVETLPHGFAPQKIGGFLLRHDLAPEIDRHDHSRRIPVRIRDVLDFCDSHDVSDDR